MLHWCQKSFRTSMPTMGPVVAPQVTSRPARARQRSDRGQLASPTLSTTTSAPRRPVMRFTSATRSCVAWFTR